MNVFAQQHTIKPGLDNPTVAGNNHLAGGTMSETALASPYSYDCSVAISVIGGGVLIVEFKQDKSVIAMLKGSRLGEIGGYTGWGTAWLNIPVEELIGQPTEVRVELVVTQKSTAQVQFIQAGIVVGGCSTRGVGFGCGLGSGQGEFMPFKP